MKLILKQDDSVTEAEISIHYRRMDDRLESLVKQIQLYDMKIAARKDGRNCYLTPAGIFYFESVEERTWMYLKDEVYECPKRLYELEQLLKNTTFVRISRAFLLNTQMVESVRPLLGRRLEACLDNGEKLIVNRHYVPLFKEKFRLEGNEI